MGGPFATGVDEASALGFLHIGVDSLRRAFHKPSFQCMKSVELCPGSWRALQFACRGHLYLPDPMVSRSRHHDGTDFGTRALSSSSAPSTPTPPSPSADPSRPPPAAADRATETPDDTSPQASPRDTHANARAANSATASPPADTSPRSHPAQRSPPAAPHQSAAAETASRYSPPPAPARGSPAACTSRYRSEERRVGKEG